MALKDLKLDVRPDLFGFTEHSACTGCPWGSVVISPGLPMVPANYSTLKKPQHSRALVIVGQAPTYSEDANGVPWSGKQSAQLTKKFVSSAGFENFVDVYYSYATRCRVSQQGNATQSHLRACREHLAEDLAILSQHYEDVILFGLGAKACYSIAHYSSLNESLKNQGTQTRVFGMGEKDPHVFFTYNPGILNARNQPQKVQAVEAHFILLLRYLQGDFIPNDVKIKVELGATVPKDFPERFSCDIETYGILEGNEQTVFHPVKAREIDGFDAKDWIVTIAFGYRDGDTIRSFQYIWNNPGHRRKIRQWFEKACKNKSRLIGQHTKFDLSFLAASDAELRHWIDPRRLTIDDLMLMSFLLYEQQPEKGLKELATLFGIADYSGLKVTGKSGRAKGPKDKNLHYYNCLDVVVTLLLYEEIERRIKEKYGPKTPKLGKVCAWMRNIVLWDTLDLETNGSTLAIDQLKKFHQEEKDRCDVLMNESTEKGLLLAGTGSDKPLREFMFKCVGDAGLLDDPRVIYSPKTKKISIGVENVNLVVQYMEEGQDRDLMNNFQEYKERSKIITTYTGPLLDSKRKGIVIRQGNRGMVYPGWYAVPMYFDRGGSDSDTKGQIQGRFSCSQPARMTEPASIRKCSTSRWPKGTLTEYDVNQDHLRMAALLSGDPELMAAYETPGESVHTRTALTIFPDLDPKTIKKEHPNQYKLGKTLNFLVLFCGGGNAFQSTALSDCGIEVELDFCFKAIQMWDKKHHVFRAWQDSLVDQVAEKGYLVTPTGWGRTFGLGRVAADAAKPEICNSALQLPCAQMLQSSHFKVLTALRRKRLRSVVCLQIYDALFVDKYPGEEEQVDEIVGEAMTNPPLLPVLERWAGRSLPWVWEKKEYQND
jgi:uracil-DNA glycosylase family 4